MRLSDKVRKIAKNEYIDHALTGEDYETLHKVANKLDLLENTKKIYLILYTNDMDCPDNIGYTDTLEEAETIITLLNKTINLGYGSYFYTEQCKITKENYNTLKNKREN